ncbi:hypothetical protein LEM8419_01117 [Neolewinella maritima]|uniref:YiaAB two helix domain-containing protein n=1 Tax=Neolewinella maritima TaxID=1383882 RepID=A0ABM9AYW4_9BACT|nr:hypothetical protein [Neolewinella maritima]CAH0999827.1 hypothetical protein LEM8419_01117 [Neolewinella maritima]
MPNAYDRHQQYRSWITKAPLGLVLTGFGASLISASAVQKQSGAPPLQWIVGGTIALAVFNSGLSILADASKHRAHYERLRDAPNPPSPVPA